jgi:ubiquinone/menaquinone biosynthesis C-methylase UbiE
VVIYFIFAPPENINLTGKITLIDLSDDNIVNIYENKAINYDSHLFYYPLFGIDIKQYQLDAANALDLSEGDTVVELGCGTGLNFPFLLDIIGSTGKIIGVDIAKNMLVQAKKRIDENGWKNVELIHSDIAEYDIPKDVDGILSTGAITYSSSYDKVIKNGYDSLKSGKRLVIVDYKMPSGPTMIFAPIVVFFAKSFGVKIEYMERHPWESVEKYFEKTNFTESYGGFLYMSVGKKS